MMNKMILSLFVLSMSHYAFAAKDKNKDKNEVDKIYSVPITKSEILIENPAPLMEKNANERPAHLFYLGIVRGSLTYKLPTLNGLTTDFSPSLVGVSAGVKTANKFYLFKGNLELDGEWQGFKRESGGFSQKLNVYQLNVIQNLDLYWPSKRSFYFSAGVGLAPVYLTAEQSIFGNSYSAFGLMGLLKFDFILPIKRKYELDLNLKGGWGSVGAHEIFLSTVGLGLNFE